MKDLQPYDITVSLSVPRSPPNLELGNFMVSLHLLDSPAAAAKKAQSHVPPHPHSHFEKRTILFSSRRPVIIPYTDPLVSLASRLLFIAYHILFPSSETSALKVPMMERILFARTSLIPGSLFLELEAGQALQVYGVSVTLTARLSGLRWFMYHYMITSFVVLTSLFWMFEMLIAALTWLALSAYLSPGDSLAGAGGSQELVKRERGQVAVKPEWPGAVATKTATAGTTTAAAETTGDDDATSGGDELSDTPRSFPSYGRQPPLKYEAEIKTEEPSKLLEDIPTAGTEADDEDEDDAGGPTLDSGAGTSYSDGSRAAVRRRTSRTSSS